MTTVNRAARRAARPSTKTKLAESERKLAETEAELQQALAARNTILDILNVLLAQKGGKVVIPSVEVQAATRHKVQVTAIAGRGSAPDRHVIELEGYQDEHPQGRLAKLGLSIPGRS